MIAKWKRALLRFLKNPLFPGFYLPSFLFAVAWGVRIPVMPLFAHELTPDYRLVGLIVAGGGLGTLLADLPLGNLIRRMDKRTAMILGLAIDGISTLALVWVGSIWLAVLLRFFAGIGHAIFSIARHTFITNVTRADLRGRAISTLEGTLRIGLFLGPALGGWLAVMFGLRLPFMVFAFICATSIAAIAFSKKDVGVRPETLPRVEGDSVGLRGALKGRTRTFAMVSIGHLLAQITRAGEGLILPLWATDVLNLSPDQIGLAVSLISAVSILLFYPVGLLMDRVGRKVAIVPSFFTLALGLGLLPLTRGFGGLLLVAAVVGLGYALGTGALMTIGADLSPKRGRSAFLSAWQWIGDAGSSGGPLIVGWVAQALALPLAALAIAGASLLAGGVFAFLIPETLKDRSRINFH